MLLNPTISILDSKVKLREVRDLSKVTETPLSKICVLPSITSSTLGLTEEEEREKEQSGILTLNFLHSTNKCISPCLKHTTTPDLADISTVRHRLSACYRQGKKRPRPNRTYRMRMRTTGCLECLGTQVSVCAYS